MYVECRENIILENIYCRRKKENIICKLYIHIFISVISWYQRWSLILQSFDPLKDDEQFRRRRENDRPDKIISR